MDEKEIYRKVLDRLYQGLKTEKHDKYKNDKLGERNFEFFIQFLLYGPYFKTFQFLGKLTPAY